jgi:KaiC/GvpD/RAD55 family RecA-like ATPase
VKRVDLKLIKSGVPGLDELLGGGIVEGSILTISGPTGSGKSTLGMQFLYEGATKYDEPGIYIAIEETKGDVLFHMRGYGWDIQKAEKERKLVVLDYPVHEVDQIMMPQSAIQQIISSTGTKRLVIDSVMPIALYFQNNEDRRRGFIKFIENVRRWGVTTFIISEDMPNLDRFTSPHTEYGIETYSDGWINFFYKYDQDKMEREKYIEILKVKGIQHSTKAAKVKIDSSGMKISGAVEEKKEIKKEEIKKEQKVAKPIKEENLRSALEGTKKRLLASSKFNLKKK